MSPTRAVMIFGGVALCAMLSLASAVTSASTIPPLSLYESDENLGYTGGTWGADVDKIPDTNAEYLFIKQATIDAAVAHIHSLDDPIGDGVFTWDYWKESILFEDIGECYDDALAVSPNRPCGSFAPNPVPLPAAAWLFMSALTGLAVVARRKGK